MEEAPSSTGTCIEGELKKGAEAEVDEDELDNLLGSPSEASGGDENI